MKDRTRIATYGPNDEGLVDRFDGDCS